MSGKRSSSGSSRPSRARVPVWGCPLSTALSLAPGAPSRSTPWKDAAQPSVSTSPPDPASHLRHTHATILLTSRESVKVVSARLGHANATVTLGVYAHVMPGDQKAAADRFAALIRGANG